MPKKLHDCVNKVRAQGKSEQSVTPKQSAYAICTAQMKETLNKMNEKTNGKKSSKN
jgi:hypothetical protein